MIEVVEHAADKRFICRDILDDLPEWFGIAEAKDAFVEAVAALPMLACRRDGQVVGFLSIKQHTASAAEVYVIGVKRRWHRRGCGRGLLVECERWALDRDIALLTVKTLAPANPDPNYAATRKFYEAFGFLPIEVFPTLWDSRNPCLLMVKPLRAVETNSKG
ncbi:MAG: GNAT family N-acetyltransferase [Kiloniellales bacterium]